MDTFFYSAWESESVEQFLKETYPGNMPEYMFTADAIASCLITEDEVPEQIAYRLFTDTSLFDTYDRTIVKVLFTDDPDFVTKLKDWWFGEQHLAYARTQLPWYIGNLRNDGLTEEEIRNYSFTKKI